MRDADVLPFVPVRWIDRILELRRPEQRREGLHPLQRRMCQRRATPAGTPIDSRFTCASSQAKASPGFNQDSVSARNSTHRQGELGCSLDVDLERVRGLAHVVDGALEQREPFRGVVHHDAWDISPE